MKYSWFAAHVNVIRANVSSMVVTLVSDWVQLLLSNCCLDFKEICRKKILEVNCVLFMLYTKMTVQVFDWLTHFPILSNRYNRMAKDFL